MVQASNGSLTARDEDFSFSGGTKRVVGSKFRKARSKSLDELIAESNITPWTDTEFKRAATRRWRLNDGQGSGFSRYRWRLLLGIQLFVSFQRAGLDRLTIKIKAARRKLTISAHLPAAYQL